jgi:hypothetical protein
MQSLRISIIHLHRCGRGLHDGPTRAGEQSKIGDCERVDF